MVLPSGVSEQRGHSRRDSLNRGMGLKWVGLSKSLLRRDESDRAHDDRRRDTAGDRGAVGPQPRTGASEVSARSQPPSVVGVIDSTMDWSADVGGQAKGTCLHVGGAVSGLNGPASAPA
jgi:hypothetical protein